MKNTKQYNKQMVWSEDNATAMVWSNDVAAAVVIPVYMMEGWIAKWSAVSLVWCDVGATAIVVPAPMMMVAVCLMMDGIGFGMDSCDELPRCLLLVVWSFNTWLMMDEEWTQMFWSSSGLAIGLVLLERERWMQSASVMGCLDDGRCDGFRDGS